MIGSTSSQFVPDVGAGPGPSSIETFAGTFDSSHALRCVNADTSMMSEWIIDTYATDHMSPYFNVSTNHRTLKRPIFISLLVGTTKTF